MGGMTKAVATGMPKLRIEEAAARQQARVDRGEDVIVGVNKYAPEGEDAVDILSIDNTAVREAQVRRITSVRDGRDAIALRAALDALTGAAESGKGNLLELSVSAARARATVGEISDALEKVWSRHRAVVHSIAGVYGSAYEGDDGFAKIKDEVEGFAVEEGRRPRMLVVKLGQDGHDRGAKIIATAFADIGFDVDIGPLFQTPEEAARQAAENDVHVIGVSSQAAGHRTLVPQLIAALKQEGAGEILVICGGVIPPQDYDQLMEGGVAAIYGPGTNIPVAASEVIKLIRRHRKAA
jgi:methylmalonyl-CoA mutase